MKLTWHVSGMAGQAKTERDGQAAECSGAVHVVCDLPDNTVLRDVRAELPIVMEESDRVFMNGYQTWTYCPEYTRHDRIRGVHGIPGALIRKYAFDRYSDYHFVPYLNKKGILHGVSWCCFRRGNHYQLIASLDEQPGYTLFTYDAGLNCLLLTRDCMDVTVSGAFHAFDLFFAEGSEQDVYDAWFRELGIHPLNKKKLYGYSSWYNRYQKIDEAAIRQDLAGCRTIFQPGDLFQIDDGWEPMVGDWLQEDSKKFPNGMAKMAQEIHEAGFQAGLWLAPFVAEEKSELYHSHPDWFLKINGSDWKDGCNWSGFYSLDIDHPQVQDYLRRVFARVFDEWKFDLVKLDFLYAAAPFGTSTESRAARMYRAMRFLRECCDSHPILGCGVPVMPAFGLVEYCRISCDVTLDWNDNLMMQCLHRERPSTKQAIGNILSRRALNERAYLSDPDVFFLRTENCRLTPKQKMMLGRIDALLGGVFLTSDDPSSYTDEMKAQYQELRHLTEAQQVLMLEEKGRWVIHYRLDHHDQELEVSFEN